MFCILYAARTQPPAEQLVVVVERICANHAASNGTIQLEEGAREGGHKLNKQRRELWHTRQRDKTGNCRRRRRRRLQSRELAVSCWASFAPVRLEQRRQLISRLPGQSWSGISSASESRRASSQTGETVAWPPRLARSKWLHLLHWPESRRLTTSPGRNSLAGWLVACNANSARASLKAGPQVKVALAWLSERAHAGRQQQVHLQKMRRGSGGG